MNENNKRTTLKQIIQTEKNKDIMKTKNGEKLDDRKKKKFEFETLYCGI